MTRLARRSTGTRLAFAAAVLALSAGAGAGWTSAAEPSGSTSDAVVRLAQASPGAAPSAGGTASPFDATQKAAIEAIIKDYLLANPEVMLDVQSALEAKMEQLQAEKLKTALTANARDIFRSPDAPVAGNPQGDIPVVEFFDYNCGYCKKAFGDISKLVESDTKIKLVLKELPILSKGSEEAARVALAARLQDKYWPVHRALLTIRGEVNEQSALRAVEKLGLDMTKLKSDMASEKVSAEINRVRELARTMGIQGTPHFLVGDRAIAGAPGDLLDQIRGHVAELRKTGCPVC
ncbi:MAG: DsbA family protein [Hyphomicrobiales bacterium]|nr:DsbA family protein [Hyphomicrobiales bacterium]